jgi:hypothetical protein
MSSRALVDVDDGAGGMAGRAGDAGERAGLEQVGAAVGRDGPLGVNGGRPQGCGGGGPSGQAARRPVSAGGSGR